MESTDKSIDVFSLGIAKLYHGLVGDVAMPCSQFSEKRQLIQWEGIGYLVKKMVATIFRKSFSNIANPIFDMKGLPITTPRNFT